MYSCCYNKGYATCVPLGEFIIHNEFSLISIYSDKS